ncbi:ganglioside-induced differentiation-associated protein 1-like [Lingula anatina]|uniref:Ganglioside-induced differentiation-associated protein 1-like n=1 Tax=Lingula anatina TaxID=7574 RepID=A0A1S3I9R8_LINAN|nr:ganglioside-induced differentiation-associated protein 1-like [Lingula anatina]|eukprot:XP_013394918.1 ganglioside-induced differentiation-associated protein 1-like [Lingula anatina]
MATEELTLYYFPGSYYSQRVLFYLKARSIPFKGRYMNILLGETYEPWYMRMNPKGQVPVIKHRGGYLADSCAIMQYLEKEYDTPPKLLPAASTPQREEALRFADLINSIKIEVITYGIISFPHLSQGGMLVGKFQRLMEWRAKSMGQYTPFLERYKAKSPDLEDVYIQKEKDLSEFYAQFRDEATVQRAIVGAQNVLDELEETLGKRKEGECWLCGPDMTVADVNLAILIGRLDSAGVGYMFWKNGKRPNIEAYFHRLKKNDVYKSVCEFNPFLGIFLPLVKKKLPSILGISAVLAMGAVAIYFWKKGEFDLNTFVEKVQFWK